MLRPYKIRGKAGTPAAAGAPTTFLVDQTATGKNACPTQHGTGGNACSTQTLASSSRAMIMRCTSLVPS
jgi:hypothetical protein